MKECGKNWVLLWHHQHECLYKTRGYCRKWGCPTLECRKTKAQQYIDSFIDPGNIESVMWTMEHAEQYWARMTRNTQHDRYYRMIFHDSRQVFVISKDNLTPRFNKMKELPQIEALLEFKANLLRIDIKRVTPAVNPKLLTLPLTLDDEDTLDKAIELAGFKYGAKVEDMTVEQIRKRVEVFIPNKEGVSA